MNRMRSLQAHSFGGKIREEGEIIYATDHEARILAALGRAEPADEEVEKEKPTKRGRRLRRDMQAGRAFQYETK